MEPTYFRSSSYNSWSFCAARYFLEYELNLPSDSNKAADRGNIVHKALELLAKKKFAIQTKQSTFTEDETETVFVTKSCSVKNALDFSFHHYTKTVPTPHLWEESDFEICKELLNSALELHNGAFNPLKRDIIYPEKYFDFQIEQPWAKLQNGEYLGVRGTLDLVCKFPNQKDVIELVDWKTGKQIDWATGKEKDFTSLCDDPQLRMYHYALDKLYPQAKEIIVTIVYIKYKSVYSLPFSKDDIPKTEDMLRKRFELIKNTQRPKLIKPDWRCSKLCHFEKNNWENSGKTICNFMKDEVLSIGLDRVISKHKQENRGYTGGGKQAK